MFLPRHRLVVKIFFKENLLDYVFTQTQSRKSSPNQYTKHTGCSHAPSLTTARMNNVVLHTLARLIFLVLFPADLLPVSENMAEVVNDLFVGNNTSQGSANLLFMGLHM